MALSACAETAEKKARNGRGTGNGKAAGFNREIALALWQGALQTTTCWAQELRCIAKKARADGAEVLLTPELLVPGYHLFQYTFDQSPEHIEREIGKIALEEGLAMCVGYAEKR